MLIKFVISYVTDRQSNDGWVKRCETGTESNRSLVSCGCYDRARSSRYSKVTFKVSTLTLKRKYFSIKINYLYLWTDSKLMAGILLNIYYYILLPNWCNPRGSNLSMWSRVQSQTYAYRNSPFERGNSWMRSRSSNELVFTFARKWYL